MRLRIFNTFACALALMLVSCSTGLDERYESSVLASVEVLSVPDSSRSDSLSVRLAGVLGQNSGYSFRAILSRQTDTLFEYQVYATFIEETGRSYEIRDIRYDTTFMVHILQPRTTWYFFEATGTNGTLRDSTYVRP